jgi:hypothetical protein
MTRSPVSADARPRLACARTAPQARGVPQRRADPRRSPPGHRFLSRWRSPAAGAGKEHAGFGHRITEPELSGAMALNLTLEADPDDERLVAALA